MSLDNIKNKLAEKKKFQEVLAKLREGLALRMEDLMTNPITGDFFNNHLHWISWVRRGNRLPPQAWATLDIQGCFQAACDDLRIDREERDDYADAIFIIVARADRGDTT